MKLTSPLQPDGVPLEVDEVADGLIQAARAELEADFARAIDQQTRRPSCEGCTQASCCYMSVSVNVVEAWQIARWLRELPRRVRREFERRLEVQSTAWRRSGEDSARYIGLHVPCAFLDPQRGRCQLYGRRPIPCRWWIVMSPRERCKEDNVLVASLDARPWGVQEFEAQVQAGRLVGVKLERGKARFMADAVLAELRNFSGPDNHHEER